MTNRRDTLPVCWVRFTPYQHPWICYHFGRGIQYDGVTVCDLFPARGVSDLLNEPVLINSRAEILGDASCSDQLMRILRAVRTCGPDIVNEEFNIDPASIDTFLPVCMPEVVHAQSFNRQWNATMQLRQKTATRLASLISNEFWRGMYRFSVRHQAACALQERPYTVKTMVEAFLDQYNIDTAHLDTIMRMFFLKLPKLSS